MRLFIRLLPRVLPFLLLLPRLSPWLRLLQGPIGSRPLGRLLRKPPAWGLPLPLMRHVPVIPGGELPLSLLRHIPVIHSAPLAKPLLPGGTAPGIALAVMWGLLVPPGLCPAALPLRAPLLLLLAL